MKTKCNGDLCDSGANACGARSKFGYTCTRKLGHDGSHVACAGVEHNCEIWPQAAKPKKCPPPKMPPIGFWISSANLYLGDAMAAACKDPVGNMAILKSIAQAHDFISRAQNAVLIYNLNHALDAEIRKGEK